MQPRCSLVLDDLIPLHSPHIPPAVDYGVWRNPPSFSDESDVQRTPNVPLTISISHSHFLLPEMCRLLSPDAGCLIIVSLLQSCVLRAILSHFSAQPSWLIELQMLPPVPEDSHPPFLVTCSRLNGASSSKLCVTGGGGGVETWLEGDEGGVDAALVSVGFAVEMLRMGREMAGGVQRGVVCVVDVMRGEDAGEEGLETEVKRRAEGGEGRWRVKGVERIEIGFGISKLRCTIWGNGDEGDLLELLEGDGEEGGLVGSAHLHSVSAMLES